jgi:hypothetical protein
MVWISSFGLHPDFSGGITMMRIDAGGGAGTYVSHPSVSVQSRPTIIYRSTGSEVKQSHPAPAANKVDTVEISENARRMYEMQIRANQDEGGIPKSVPSSTNHASTNHASTNHTSTNHPVSFAEANTGLYYSPPSQSPTPWDIGLVVLSLTPVGRVAKAAEGLGELAEVAQEMKNVEKGAETIGRATSQSTRKTIDDYPPSAIHSVTTDRSLPLKGQPPNSSMDKVDANGNVITRRYYDSEGKAKLDVDNTDHGNPKFHSEVPHEHHWDWSTNPPTRT